MSLRKPPLSLAIAVEVMILTTIASYFLPGGDDLYRFYLPIAQGCVDCGYNPYHTHWILYPLQFIPERFLWPIWVLITNIGIYWAATQYKTNAAIVMLSFPMMGLLWLGQTDVLLAVGFALALLSPSPYLRGLGLLLVSTKPQVAGPAILLLLWHDQAKLRTLIIPTTVFVLSLVVWGIDWPIRWFVYIMENQVAPVWVQAVLFPIGLLAFLAVLLFKNKREQLAVVLIASALGLPRFATYSHILFLLMIAPWWALPLSYAWALAYPFMGNLSMRAAWILPLALLGYMVWPVLRARLHRVSQQSEETSSPANDVP